jgi:hypothetical protein
MFTTVAPPRSADGNAGNGVPNIALSDAAAPRYFRVIVASM